MVIALDGPAGSGKSTIAKELGKELKFEYLDTGAMYRVVCLYLIENNIKVDDVTKETFRTIKIDFENEKVLLNGRDVTKEIRSSIVNDKISEVAKNKIIREMLVLNQREISKGRDIILDGRDIGTVVFPNADYKFYIEASSDIRAQRRFLQNQEMGITEEFESIKANIEKRDYEDKNRKVGPLKMAVDAILVDTSTLNLKETIDLIREEMNAKK